jgi:hypothetical protein
MLSFRHHRFGLRRAAAVSVAVLLWFASLVPLTAQWLTSSLAAACCRTKGKCCCHRAKSTGGPGISSRLCDAGCGSANFAVSGDAGFVPIEARSWAPAIHVSAHAGAADRVSGSAPSSHQLLQRPPPSIHLA